MRVTLNLPHLKPATSTANAKYRRRVPDDLRAVFGKQNVEWSLKTKDPAKIIEAWNVAHARFEAMAARRSSISTSQIKWEMVQKAAIEHGLATPKDTQIGPVDFEQEQGRYLAFTNAALTEADKLSAQQMNAKLSNSPAPSGFGLLVEAQLKGVKRPPVSLRDAADSYLKDREARATYRDIQKQVGLVLNGIEEAIEQENPTLEALTYEHAYAFRDSLSSKGNAISTIKRRMNTVNSVLNHSKKRFNLKGWDNPFKGIELPQDDGTAGEVKRSSLTLDEIKATIPHLANMNADAGGIWVLMMFTAAGPNELRGLHWDDVFLDHQVPHFEIRANGSRRLKTGERPRRVPLVGAALVMMQERAIEGHEPNGPVFPRYAVMQSSNSLSAVLIKMMKAAKVWEKTRKVPYSLRHTLKNYLRRTAPPNFQLLIFGHGHGEGSSASGYGDDDLLDLQAEYLEKAVKLWGIHEFPDILSEPCI
jgi:integrase